MKKDILDYLTAGQKNGYMVNFQYNNIQNNL